MTSFLSRRAILFRMMVRLTSRENVSTLFLSCFLGKSFVLGICRIGISRKTGDSSFFVKAKAHK